MLCFSVQILKLCWLQYTLKYVPIKANLFSNKLTETIIFKTLSAFSFFKKKIALYSHYNSWYIIFTNIQTVDRAI